MFGLVDIKAKVSIGLDCNATQFPNSTSCMLSLLNNFKSNQDQWALSKPRMQFDFSWKPGAPRYHNLIYHKAYLNFRQTEIGVADCNGSSGLSLLIQSLIIEQNVDRICLYLFHFQSNQAIWNKNGLRIQCKHQKTWYQWQCQTLDLATVWRKIHLRG